MHDGELIKKLRVSRKLTQSQLAEGICSKTSLVGIENRTIKKISFLTLMAFLDRLNITLTEYESLRNQVEEPQKTRKTRNLLNKVQEDDFDPYKEIADNRKQFKRTADLYYLVLNIHMYWKSSVKPDIQLEFLGYEIRMIEDYFMKLKEFGRYELDLLAEFPFIFSDSFIENNYLKIKKRMRKAMKSGYDQCLFLFLKNLTIYYIDKKRYKKARSINEDMYRCLGLKSKTAVIYESLMSDYYRRLIATALGEPIKKEEFESLFAVIEYTLGKEERDELEEKLLSIQAQR